MESTLYQVTGLVMPKTEVIGYQIEKAGDTKVVSLKNFKLLVAKHQVEGFRLIREPKSLDTDDQDIEYDEYIISDDIDLKDIPIIQVKSKYKKDELELIGKVIREDLSVCAYKLKDLDGEIHKFSALDTWELARRGCIKGFRATSVELEIDSRLTKVKTLASIGSNKLHTIPYEQDEIQEDTQGEES